MKKSFSKNRSNLEIPALTGIRAIAAYMIFIHHYLGANCDVKFYCPLVLEFHSGVSLFLVLSGFLITLRYYETSSLKVSWLKKYFVSRFARIYPLYFLLTIISLVIYRENLYEWFLSITLLKGLFSQYRFIAVSQSWTLTVEVMFFFFAPLIFLLHKNKTNLLLIFLSIFLTGILISSGGKIYNIAQFLSGHIFLFVYTFFGRCFEFFCGIFLALLILRKQTIRRNSFYTVLGLGGFILTLFLITTFQSQNYRFGIYSPGGLLIYTFILPVFIAVMFYGLINEITLLSRFLASRAMQLLGKSSYAFYLIHVGIIAEALPHFYTFNLLSFFIILNLIAIILYYFYEKPLNRVLKKTL